MATPDISDGSVVGIIAAAVVGAWVYLRKIYRADKSEGATNNLTVQMAESVQRVIVIMQARIDELVKDMERIRSEMAAVLKREVACQQQNLMLTTTVKKLTDRVAELESKR